MDTVAFQIGPWSVYWYGVFAALGFLAAFWTASRRAPLSGLSSELVMDLALPLIAGAVIGARLFYVVTFWNEYFAHKPWFEIFMIRHGGMVWYGGFVGSCVATILYTRWRKLPLWKVADVLGPSIALGHAFGRLGCLMNGCCYGGLCRWPWAIHFPKDHETQGMGVHPTQIYEALLNFALYGLLAWSYRRKRFDGQVFAWYLVGYAVVRAFVEGFRGDYSADQLWIGRITPAQRISILVLGAGLVLMWRLSRRRSAPEGAVTDK